MISVKRKYNNIIINVKQYCLRFKMNVVLVNCTQIKELNQIINRHNIFTKMSKKIIIKIALKIG